MVLLERRRVHPVPDRRSTATAIPRGGGATPHLFSYRLLPTGSVTCCESTHIPTGRNMPCSQKPRSLGRHFIHCSSSGRLEPHADRPSGHRRRDPVPSWTLATPIFGLAVAPWTEALLVADNGAGEAEPAKRAAIRSWSLPGGQMSP